MSQSVGAIVAEAVAHPVDATELCFDFKIILMKLIIIKNNNDHNNIDNNNNNTHKESIVASLTWDDQKARIAPQRE